MKKLLLALLAGLVSISVLSACADEAYLGGEDEEEDEDDEAITTTVPADGETTAPGTTTPPPQTEETPDSTPDTHNHTAGDVWMVDANNHWHICSCGEIMDLSAHSDPEDCADCNTSIIRWDDGMVDLTQYNDKSHCIFEAEYDENGNLLAKATYAYTYTANDLIEACKTTVYNENGEVVSITDVSCTYDANGNVLTEIEVYNNVEDDYSYTTKYTFTYTDLDNILSARALMQDKPVILVLQLHNPLVPAEFEPAVDGILAHFGLETKILMELLTGEACPGGRLPVLLPASMETVEAHCEDVPDDMEAYTDSCGNRYGFGFGLSYGG